jgi:molybdopterin-guanine dinucleotide biosynthesis protein A
MCGESNSMLTSMFDVEGFILVGGQSRRMGTDKSRLLFAGQTGVDHIAGALRPLTPMVRLAGARDQYDDFQNVPDLHESWGALGGIHSALDACQSTWALIAACDLPLVTTELFMRLWHSAAAAEGFDAIVPVQPDGRPQPLAALYRRASCLPAATTLIAAGEHKPRALLAGVKTHWVQFQDLADLPGANDFFLNVNTPEDYERAKAILGDRVQNR